MATQTATVTQMRHKLNEVLVAVSADHHQQVTNYERPVAVVVPVDWYEYAAACIRRVEQLDTAFSVRTVRVAKPKTPEDME